MPSMLPAPIDRPGPETGVRGVLRSVEATESALLDRGDSPPPEGPPQDREELAEAEARLSLLCSALLGAQELAFEIKNKELSGLVSGVTIRALLLYRKVKAQLRETLDPRVDGRNPGANHNWRTRKGGP